MERELFIERLADPAPDLVKKVLLEPDLGEMDPFAFARPVEVARRYLRLRDECLAALSRQRLWGGERRFLVDRLELESK